MRKAFILSFFVIQLSFFIAQSQTLSPQATFSLVTISPGDELYSTFGHSILHVVDVPNGINLSISYGGFDFNAKGFYIKFMRGTLPYQMTMHNRFDDEINFYLQEEHRTATEQVLNLSQTQKQNFYNYLTNNYLPENREYHYKFFYDNCATRFRDVLQQVCGDSLKFSTTLHADSSYRQWIKYYSHERKQWSEFGMDLAIGEPSDRKTGWAGAMFLPDNLSQAFDAAKITKNGKVEPLVLVKNQLTYLPKPPLSFVEKTLTPTIIFWFLLGFIAVLTFVQLYKTNYSLIFDKILFSFVGLVGWLIVFLWFFTDHGVTANNLNIIWAYPLLFPIALMLKKQPNRTWLSKHFLAYGIIQLLFLLSWKFLPQSFHPAMIPVVLILAIRAFYVWWRIRQKLSSF